MTTPQAADTLRAKLTLDVTYALNGMSAESILSHLHRAFESAIGNGALSGHTEAEVAEHSMEILQVHADLDEDQLADFMTKLIESGDLALEDIPVRLARYGLMNPAAFINEMSERMQGDSDEESPAAPKMRIFEFGTAPQAVAEGYAMNGTLYSTVDELNATYGTQDLIFIYGASVHGKPGVFEFARFEPISASTEAATPDATKRLIDGGNAYGLLDDQLVSAPIFVDGRIDEESWGPIEFGHISDGEAAYCRAIEQALKAMAHRHL